MIVAAGRDARPSAGGSRSPGDAEQQYFTTVNLNGEQSG
jgi:hypothetical protein